MFPRLTRNGVADSLRTFTEVWVTKRREGRAGALYLAVGAEVRTRRSQRGLKQEDLSQLVGLSRASVANVEGGRQAVPIHLLAEIAEALGTTCSDVLASAETRVSDQAVPPPLPSTVMAFVQRKVRAGP